MRLKILLQDGLQLHVLHVTQVCCCEEQQADERETRSDGNKREGEGVFLELCLYHKC